MPKKNSVLCSAIQCDECKEVIVSLYRHDFRSCGCGKIAIDGGRDYTRTIGTKFTELRVRLSKCYEGEINRQEEGF